MGRQFDGDAGFPLLYLTFDRRVSLQFGGGCSWNMFFVAAE